MWRNESHLTATYAKQLAPAVRSLVEDVLEQSDRDLDDEGHAAATAGPSDEP
jgi:hypothetical protein